MKMNDFIASFAKVNKTNDGGRQIWGYATLEKKDKAGEIADFNGTVKAFQKWSNEVSKRTGGKSLGNIRLMHSNTAVGKMTHWEPSERTLPDENGEDQIYKGIYVGVYVPPTKPEIIKDVDEGILNAFSIGGSYEKRWYDNASKAFRYIPELAEFSLVDNPCVEGADVMNVIAKADGPWQKRDKTPEVQTRDQLEKEVTNSHETPPKDKPKDKGEYADPDNYKYPIDEAHIKAAVSYFNHDGEKEKGGYSDEQWANIGGRIASAANRLIGEGHKYENGKITVEKKEAEKAMNEEAIKKAAESAGIPFESLQAFFKAMDNNAQGETTQSVATISGEGKGESTANVGEAQSTVEQAEKDTGICKAELDTLEKAVTDLKAEYETLEKSGKAISDKNKVHLTHAINHVKAALEGGDYTDADLSIDNSNVGDGPNSGMESPEAVAECDKFTKNDLTKAVGDEVNKSVNKIEALFKGVATLESLDKLKEKFEDVLKINEKIENMEKMVKEIHETPQAGGPVLNGGIASMQKFNAGAAEEDVLEKMIGQATDPMIKDKLSQELAIRQAKSIYK